MRVHSLDSIFAILSMTTQQQLNANAVDAAESLTDRVQILLDQIELSHNANLPAAVRQLEPTTPKAAASSNAVVATSPSCSQPWSASLLHGYDPSVIVSNSKRTTVAASLNYQNATTSKKQKQTTKHHHRTAAAAFKESAAIARPPLKPHQVIRNLIPGFESIASLKSPNAAVSATSSAAATPAVSRSSSRLFTSSSSLSCFDHSSHPFFYRLRIFDQRGDWLRAIMELDYFKTHREAQQYEFVLRRYIEVLQKKADQTDVNSNISSYYDSSQPGSRFTKNSGRGLEHYVAFLFRLRFGWQKTIIRAGPQDGGIDVLAMNQDENTGEITQSAIQCKQYYPSHHTVQTHITMEVISAYHSVVTRLPYYNLQEIMEANKENEQQRRTNENDSSYSNSKRKKPLPSPSATSDSSTIPSPSLLTSAYLVTTGTFPKQGRAFIKVFNAHQKEKRERMEKEKREYEENVKEMEKQIESIHQASASVPSLASTASSLRASLTSLTSSHISLLSRHSNDFLGSIHLIDSDSLLEWLNEIETRLGKEVLEREEVELAIMLVSNRQVQSEIFHFASTAIGTPSLSSIADLSKSPATITSLLTQKRLDLINAAHPWPWQCIPQEHNIARTLVLGEQSALNSS